MSRKPRPRAGFIACALVSMLAWAAGAAAQQSGGGTLTGSVIDRDGIVPGANVTVTAEATSTTRTVVTNELGQFRLPGLAPGQYTVKVEMAGFSPVTMNQIQLSSGEIRDVGKLTLTVGQQSETVVVTAAVTPVQVSTSSRKGEITADELTNISMKGRDIYGMLALIPGVQDTNFSRDFTNWESAKLTTINGAPVNNKSLMIDGINVMDEGGTGNAFVNPNLDAVGEVQVIANGFTAENGRNNGGLVNFITKSGTNRYSGSAWYNMRRDAWNANDYIRIRNNQAKPLYRVSIPGWSIGGPVVIPRLIDSRTSTKKVFFFVSQEYTDDAKPTVLTRANVPTPKERKGDFSETFQTTGSGANTVFSVQPIIDPLTGVQFPGNVIPPERINQIGQRLLNLLQMPNGYVSSVANEKYSYNYVDNQTPLHNRTDHVMRIDADVTKNTRISSKLLADREDNILFSQWGPGQGVANNFVPGWVLSGTATTVIRPTLVNEINGGFSINHYGFRSPSDGSSSYPGAYSYEDYFCAALNACTPRIQPYGTGFASYEPGHLVCCSFDQADQYPYVAITGFGGGTRPNLAGFSPGAVNGRVMPAANRNHRYQFQDDLTKVTGRHSFKFGVYLEIDSKTEPGTTNYMGNFNFGSTTTNPSDTGNGYANALLGIFQTYSEANKRVDKDVRHWQNEFYAQDSWKVNPRFTFDYGVRVTHSGPFYEIHNATAAFYPELYDAAKAPRIYRQACSNPAIQGNQTCPANQRFAVDPLFPTQFVSFAYAGNFVPNTGDPYNGMKVNGMGNGQYWHLPYLVAAPRLGMAWDINGDGKMALRSSFGVFYNFPRGQPSQFVGTAPVSVTTTVRNATIDQLANFQSGQLVSTSSPISSATATEAGAHYNLPVSYEANIAFQRDIGFNTVVDVAWVGNFITNDYRAATLDVLPLYVYSDPKNQFNGAAISANYLRVKFPGMGNITDTVTDTRALEYHSLQVGVKRRLSRGLQMGVAYTLSKGMGMQGYDEYTADPNITMINVGGTAVRGGDDAMRARYWGPTAVDRRHNLVLNYSYEIPSPNNKWLAYPFGNWQISGVTKFITGTAVNPACSSTNSGLANTDPTYTGQTARCMLTGEPLFANIPANDDPLAQQHFNPAAFKMAAPVSATVGNFGDTPLGLLRNPSWSNWDVTFSRRFPIKALGGRAGVRLQLQTYNMFNQVQFITMNTTLQFTGAGNTTLNSANTGKYTAVNPPRQFGITARFDF